MVSQQVSWAVRNRSEDIVVGRNAKRAVLIVVICTTSQPGQVRGIGDGEPAVPILIAPGCNVIFFPWHDTCYTICLL